MRRYEKDRYGAAENHAGRKADQQYPHLSPQDIKHLYKINLLFLDLLNLLNLLHLVFFHVVTPSFLCDPSGGELFYPENVIVILLPVAVLELKFSFSHAAPWRGAYWRSKS